MFMLLLIILIFLYFCSNKYEDFKIKHKIFIKKTFRTLTEQRKGLMFKKKINNNEGFLFEYKKPTKASFWMKNTFVPLDILFLNSKKKIIGLLKNMKPHDMEIKTIDKKAKYAIEIKSGYIDKYKIKEGIYIDFT